MVEAATGEIVITSSAAGIFESDFVRKVVRNFADPEVGVVTGEFRTNNPDMSKTSGSEGLYWRYEMFLRSLESKLGLLAVTGGVCLGFRKEIYRKLSPSSDADNMVPLWGLFLDKRVVFDPDAIVYDEGIENPHQQIKNRTRQVTKSQRDTFRIPVLLNPFANVRSSFSLWSHKIFRWWTPFFAIVAFIINMLLLDKLIYQAVFFLLILIVGISILLLFFPKLRETSRVANGCASFLFINYAFFRGTLNVLFGKKIYSWETNVD